MKTSYTHYYKKTPTKKDMIRLIKEEGAYYELLEQFDNIKKRDWKYVRKARTLNILQKRAFEVLQKQDKDTLGENIVGNWEDYPTWWIKKYGKPGKRAPYIVRKSMKKG